MLAVLVSWAIFAGGDMGALFAKNGFYSADFFYYIKSYAVIILLGIIFSTDYPKKLFEKYITSKAVKYVITALIAALSVLMLIGDSYNPFLYFRF